MTIWHGRGAVGEPAFDAGPHPFIEEIAALIDGRLEEAERDRVAGHLADCAECYELFVETASFQQEEEEEEAADHPVVPFPGRKKRMSSPFGDRQRLGRVARQAAAVAAVLLVGVGGAWIYQRSQIPEMIVAELVAPLEGKIQVDRDLRDWKTMRGPGDVPDPVIDIPLNERSFKLGALLVDLRLALEGDSSEKATDLLGRIANIMDDSYFQEDRAKAYRSIAERINQGAASSTFIDEVEELARASGEERASFEEIFDPSFLAFGKWAEAGRLSAVARSPDFFEDRNTWRFLDRLQENEAGRLEPVAEQLDLIESTARGKDLGAAEYESLEKAFGTIIERYDV